MHKTRKDPFVKQKKINRIEDGKRAKFIKENGIKKEVVKIVKIGEYRPRRSEDIRNKRVQAERKPLTNYGAIVIEEVNVK